MLSALALWTLVRKNIEKITEYPDRFGIPRIHRQSFRPSYYCIYVNIRQVVGKLDTKDQFPSKRNLSAL